MSVLLSYPTYIPENAARIFTIFSHFDTGVGPKDPEFV